MKNSENVYVTIKVREKGQIWNEQSGDIHNIGHTEHREKNTTTQKTQKISNMEPITNRK